MQDDGLPLSLNKISKAFYFTENKLIYKEITRVRFLIGDGFYGGYYLIYLKYINNLSISSMSERFSIHNLKHKTVKIKIKL